MTKREMFAAIREVVIDNAEMTAFIDHEIELLVKKSSVERKPTKVQLENTHFKEVILAYLIDVGVGRCIKDLQSEIPEISGLSNQRVTHLMTALVNENKVTKEYVKKTPFYAAIVW
jgi:hypothetical protein